LVPQLVTSVSRASVHWLSGSCPTATFAQLPRLPVSAQDLHVPVQVELQQTPCWQSPDAHSVAPAQVVPSGFFVHVPPLQTFCAAQSAVVVQLTLQAFAVVSHTKFPHDVAVAATQVPVPLHMLAGVNVATMQLAARQVVPAAYLRQPPLPSQVPSLAQVAAPASAHWLRGS